MQQDTVQAAVPPAQWQPLPSRGAVVAAVGGASMALPLAVIGFVSSNASGWISPWSAGPACLLAGIIIGGWTGWRRHRRVRWQLDDAGFGLRRGNWWQSETRVPISRVQHLDLKRGPLERGFGLATLVVHTAGTRMATVSVSGLDAADAERLRDRLSHQLDHDDAL